MKIIDANDHSVMMEKLLLNHQQSFFQVAKRVNSSFVEMQSSKKLSTFGQIYHIELNYFMAMIADLTHPRSVWSFSSGRQGHEYDGSSTAYVERGLYLKQWVVLKEKYIELIINLFRNINHDEIRESHEISFNFKGLLDTVYFKQMLVFKAFILWTGDTLKHLLSEHSSDATRTQTVNFLFDLEKEMQFLHKSIYFLSEVASKHNHTLTITGLNLDAILSYSAEQMEKISQFRSVNQKLDSTKSSIADVHSSRLIKEESARLTGIETRLALRLASREQPHYHIVTTNDESEESLSLEEIDLDKVNLIDKDLLEFQLIDEAAITLAQEIECKSRHLFKFLQSRFKCDIPLPRTIHDDTLHRINVILFDYYQLTSLHTKHRLLSQNKRIQIDESLQDGIKVSQERLKILSDQIEDNMKHILFLTDKMIQIQKKNKNDKIFEFGKTYAATHHLVGLTDQQIMKEGKRIYREIGQRKIANNEELSEYSAQREFLQLIQLSFSGIEYLQEKMKPHLSDNPNGALKELGFFNVEHIKRKRAEMGNARFEGLLGLILRFQYKKSGDIAYLNEAMIHFKNSQEAYGKEEGKEALSEIERHINEIEKILIDKSSLKIRLSI
jgi:hypothetical protein